MSIRLSLKSLKLTNTFYCFFSCSSIINNMDNHSMTVQYTTDHGIMTSLASWNWFGVIMLTLELVWWSEANLKIYDLFSYILFIFNVLHSTLSPSDQSVMEFTMIHTWSIIFWSRFLHFVGVKDISYEIITYRRFPWQC